MGIFFFFFFSNEPLRFDFTDSSRSRLAAWWKFSDSYTSVQHPETSVVPGGNFVLSFLLHLDFRKRSKLRSINKLLHYRA